MKSQRNLVVEVPMGMSRRSMWPGLPAARLLLGELSPWFSQRRLQKIYGEFGRSLLEESSEKGIRELLLGWNKLAAIT